MLNSYNLLLRSWQPLIYPSDDFLEGEPLLTMMPEGKLNNITIDLRQSKGIVIYKDDKESLGNIHWIIPKQYKYKGYFIRLFESLDCCNPLLVENEEETLITPYSYKPLHIHIPFIIPHEPSQERSNETIYGDIPFSIKETGRVEIVYNTKHNPKNQYSANDNDRAEQKSSYSAYTPPTGTSRSRDDNTLAKGVTVIYAGSWVTAKHNLLGNMGGRTTRVGNKKMTKQSKSRGSPLDFNAQPQLLGQPVLPTKKQNKTSKK